METLDTPSTVNVIIGMLTENTGKHFLDSGGAYGRNWERNQSKNFPASPVSYTDFSVYRKSTESGPGKLEMCASVSLYHWMVHNLEFDPELQARMDAHADTLPDTSWFGIAEKFANMVQAEANDSDAGMYRHEVQCTNTYNHTDDFDLSQTVQYWTLDLEGCNYEPTHVVLMVHGGCDVRGGYTAPKCFRLRREYHEFLNSAKVGVIAAGDDCWYIDGYSRAERSERNDTDIQDIFDVPAVKPDWADSDKVREIEAALPQATAQRNNLAQTSLTGDALARAQADMTASVVQMEVELQAAVLDYFSEEYGEFILVEDSEAWLFTPQSDLNKYSDGMKLDAYPSYL